MYGSETWPVTQRMEDRMDATEMRMLRHIYGISYEDHVENIEIRRQAGVKEISTYMRKRRLQWHGHVCRREEEEDIRQVTNLVVGSKRRRGRPRQQWKDTIKSDMSRWGLEQEDVNNRVRWHSLIELGASRTATR